MPEPESDEPVPRLVPTPDEHPGTPPETPATAPEQPATVDEHARPDEHATPDGQLTSDEPTRPARAEPTEDELLRVAVPRTVRRAPRYGAFIGAGVILGLVVGLLVAVLVDRGAVTDGGGVLPFLGGSTGPRLLSALSGAVVGALVGAAVALWADRRSLHR